MSRQQNIADFLEERRYWLRVEAIDRPNGGWDVMLRLDGTYFGESYATKAEMVAFFAHRLHKLLGDTVGTGR